MTPRRKNFINTFKGAALNVQNKTGISAVAILTQAAVESADGTVAPGFMFFGVKDTDGVNGNEQLLTTTEYSSKSNLKFPVVLSVTPVIRNGVKMFKYKVKDYFRKYNNAEECFLDHANFLQKNKRYATALKCKSDPIRFIQEISKAGYATDPNYANVLISVAKDIQKNM